MSRHLVVTVDVGIKNLALCAYDFLTNQVVFWDNLSLVPNGRYIPALNVQYVRDFVTRHSDLFYNAGAIVIERQMRCNMRIIEAVLQSMFFDRCVVINARCVKMHYNLSTRNYRQNKAKAVEWADKYVAANCNVFADGVLNAYQNASQSSDKKDDFADALIMLLYYLDTYSNQVPVQ